MSRLGAGCIASWEPALSTVVIPPLLSESGEGFHSPSLADFFPDAVLFAGTPFELNRVMLMRLLVAVVLVAVFWLIGRRLTLVPGRAQSVIEIMLDLVRKGLAEEMIGKEKGKPYVNLLTFMFFSILAMNITGVIPGLNLAASSRIGFPLTMAAVAYVAFVYAGIKNHGVTGYLKASLFPSGVPWPIYILLTPIELISTFVLRPITLSIRLMVNMVAGHLLLVLCFSATNFLFLEMSGAIKAAGAVTLLAGVAFTLFEVFIAFLQAYIFTLLTAVYINLSVDSH